MGSLGPRLEGSAHIELITLPEGWVSVLMMARLFRVACGACPDA